MIKKLKKEDITKDYVDKLNDKQFMKYSRHKSKNHTLKSSIDYFSELDLSDNLYLSINDLKTKKLIGSLTVYFKKKFSVADMGIFICSKNHSSKGYGSEAWINVMNFLSEKMKVKNITGGCHFNHIKMIKIFENSDMSYSHKNLKNVYYIKKFK